MTPQIHILRLKLFLLSVTLTLGTAPLSFAKNPSDSLRFESIMKQAADAQKKGNYPSALEFLEEALHQAEISGNKKGKLRVWMESSLLRLIRNDFDIALQLLFSAEALSQELQDTMTLAEVYNTIGANFHMQDEYEKASDYYKSSIDLYLSLGKKVEIARAYNNIGVLWKDRNDPFTALQHHRKSLALWQSMNEESWVRVTKMHIGVAHKMLNNLDSAKIYLMQILEGIEAGKEYRTLAMIYAELGDIAIAFGNYSTALKWCQKGLELASSFKVNNYQMSNCRCLYQAYENLQQPQQALKYYKRYAAFQDSIFNKEKAKEMIRVEMGHQFEREQIADSLQRIQEQVVIDLQHKEELAHERADRNTALGIGLGIFLLAGGLWSRLRYVRRAQRSIKKERDRSDELLLNILPAEIATELKRDGVAQAKRYEQAAILFTDFKDFTTTAGKMPATELVKEINTCFTEFDNICDRHNIEKIKTIGDAYMAAGGIPIPDSRSTAHAVKAALGMQQFMKKRAQYRSQQGLPSFQMRAGIHVGPIVAGIVGVRKFQYDIWGDTVNLASRMESSGQTGKVNVSQKTYEILKDESEFVFEHRGKIAAKGKGEIEMWFVEFNPNLESQQQNFQ